jgi:hypothetical protein
MVASYLVMAFKLARLLGGFKVVVGSLSSLVIDVWRSSMCFLLQFNFFPLSGKKQLLTSFALVAFLADTKSFASSTWSC